MQFNWVLFQHIHPKLFCPYRKCVNFSLWPFFAYTWETILLVFEHPPNKMECDFYQLFSNSWLNICFFTVDKAKLQIIIYQTMSPQTKSITSHASLFILFTHYLAHPNYKRHCDYSQQLQFFFNTLYSVTYTATVFQKLLQILSVETKKPWDCSDLKTGLWCEVFSYVNLPLS